MSEYTPGREPTPGTWEFMPISTRLGDTRFLVLAKDVQVLDTTHEANARLIAAAPELLEVCRSLVEYADDQGWLGEPFFKLSEEARAVLKKAEGKP